VYRGAYDGFFVQDDFSWQVESQFTGIQEYLQAFLRFNPARVYRPLSQETFFLVCRTLFGMQPFGYHAVCITIHLLGVISVYFLLRQFFAVIPCLAAALFYGIHNAHFRSLYWISAVAEPMALVYYVIAFLFFVRFTRTDRRLWYLLSFAAVVLGIMSKESILTFPLVALAYSFFFSKNHWIWSIPYFAVPFAYAILRITGTAGVSPYALTFGKEVLQYLLTYLSWSAGFSEPLLKLELQWDLQTSYSLIGAATAGAIVIVALLSGKRGPAAFGALWFVIALQPVLYFSRHIYPYYLAPSLVGMAILIAWVIAALQRFRPILFSGMLIFLVTFFLWIAESSVKREGEWWNERSFVARDILKQMPDVDRQVPTRETAIIFGLKEFELGALMQDAAFKAYGFSPSRFILAGLNKDIGIQIASLEQRDQLGLYHAYVYSGGHFYNRTHEFRMNPKSFYAAFMPAMLGRPEVQVVPKIQEVVAGQDTLVLQVANLDAPAVDIMYTLNGIQMPPALNWQLNEKKELSVFLDQNTATGIYQYTAIRDSKPQNRSEWIKIDTTVIVK
jgi:hypothetical protein